MPETSICGLTDSVRVGPLPDPDPDPTLAPDSARISISSAAADNPVSAWLDSNLNPSVVYERHDSAKETTNPKSNNNNNNPNPKNSRSKSQRFSSSSGAGSGGTNLKAEGPIFGLPARIRHVSCSVSRRPPPPSTSGRIFPKKKKPIESEPEPTSPKVSCFGKVSSDRERTTETTKDPDPDPKPGCFACFFSCGGGGRRPKLLEEQDDDVTVMKSSNKSVISLETTKTAAVAPGLGGMKRFSSGRRPASWGGEGDDDFGIDRESVFGRRSVGCLEEHRD